MTRVDKAVLDIKEMILSERYDQDGFLPSEGELSEILQVSRMTIREAVRTLEVRGFVERLHGKGIKVSDKSSKVMVQAMDDMFEKSDLCVEDVLEVRAMLEPKAAFLAAQRADSEDIISLTELVEKMDNAAVVDEEYLSYDFKFHIELVKCTKNQMMIAIVNAYSQWLKTSIQNTVDKKENLEHNYGYHRHILDAITLHDSEKAFSTMQEHLNAAFKNYKKMHTTNKGSLEK